jgi:hypothetical protein
MGKTQSDVLREYYPDLAAGRFAVLADFEDPAHQELFELVGSDPAVCLNVAETGGVSATGGRCLEFTLNAPEDRLTAGANRSAKWMLKRDWRPYNLLLMNVYSPVEPLELELVLVAGRGSLASNAVSQVLLRKGWNLLRLDLGEAADFIAVDEVHEIRWSVPDLDQPVRLKLDDVLLADNRVAVFGDRENGDGRLYVVQDGRRLIVGAGGRFEFAFANGQLSRWYSLGDDPARLHNLVGQDGALGPLPVALAGGADNLAAAAASPMAGFAALGDVVTVGQRIVEASEVRVVAECDWTFGSDLGPDRSDAARLSWRYTIYPHGRVYVDLACTTQHADFQAQDLALMVTRMATPETPVRVHTAGDGGGSGQVPRDAFVCIGGSREAELLWVVRTGDSPVTIDVTRDPSDARLSFLARGWPRERPKHRWSCMLQVWPKGLCAEPLAGAGPGACFDAPPVELLVGELKCDSPGDYDADGFNEREGALVVRPESNRVLLRLGGEGTTLVNQVVCVTDIAGREPWVYVDHVIHQPVARVETRDLLVFELPTVSERELTVEVYLRGKADGPEP